MHDQEKFKNQFKDLNTSFLIFLKRHFLDNFPQSGDSEDFKDLHELKEFQPD